MCIRAEEGYCCIEYMVCPDQVDATAGNVQPGFSLDPTLTTGATDDDCLTHDYVGIDMSGALSAGKKATRLKNFRTAFLHIYVVLYVPM